MPTGTFSDCGHPMPCNPGLPAEETVARIHAQGGLAIAAHPFAPRWWHKHGLCRGEREVYDRVAFDGVEVANSTPLLFLANFRARKYQQSARGAPRVHGGERRPHALCDRHEPHLVSRRRLRRSQGAIENRTSRGWGPSFQPLRAYRYARKVPEIRERDAQRKAREAEGGDACASCGAGCAAAKPPQA